jgi:hypothetical protein
VVLDFGQQLAPGRLQQPNPLFDIKIGQTVDDDTGQHVRPSEEHAVPGGGLRKRSSSDEEPDTKIVIPRKKAVKVTKFIFTRVTSGRSRY